ncbi:MAG: FAD-dependent oxidoreductase [Deltaproteobacteria bacterium]|nr:FAD-dependent oxidoreductase [Deltaproteobacteria bacterium]
MSARPIVILGAGLTGLSAARHLPPGSYRLIEREARVGGHAVTEEHEGWRFDRTGHLLHLRDAETRAMIEGLLEGELLEIERRSKVWSHGVFTDYPFQANTYGLPREIVRECLVGFIEARVAAAKSSRAPSTFEDLILGQFGEGIARHFMIPYNTKIWGVHPREMTASWCERFVPVPSIEDIVQGALGPPRSQLGYNARFLYPRRGISALPEALARGLHVELGRQPVAVDPVERTVTLDDGERVQFEVALCTAPLPRLIGLMAERAPAAVRDAARLLRHTGLWYLDVGLERPPRTDLHWAYVPEERLPFYRVGVYTNFSAELAPPGRGSLYVELSSRSRPDMLELGPVVARGLEEMGLIRDASEIAFTIPRFLEHAYVIPDRRTDGALRTILPFLEEHRIFAAGRYGAWTYSSMEDAIVMGKDAARRALEVHGG